VNRHPIMVLADGTRVYSNGTRYRPKAPEERVYEIRKPSVEGAVLWAGVWHLPLDLLPLEARSWPETRPDTDAYDHAAKSRRCRCDVCRRPAARKWRNRWRRDQRTLVS
jgi:hypothetical protein